MIFGYISKLREMRITKFLKYMVSIQMGKVKNTLKKAA